MTTSTLLACPNQMDGPARTGENAETTSGRRGRAAGPSESEITAQADAICASFVPYVSPQDRAVVEASPRAASIGNPAEPTDNENHHRPSSDAA